MAFTLDTTAQLPPAGSTLTASYTCGAGARLLLVQVVTFYVINPHARDGGNPTYNGVELTQAGYRQYGTFAETANELFYLIDPPIGTYDVVIPDTNLQVIYCSVTSFKADGTVTYDNAAGKAISASGEANPYYAITRNGQPNLVFSSISGGWNNWADPVVSGTNVYNGTSGSAGWGAQYTTTSATGSVDVTWTWATGEDYSICGAVFDEAAAPAAAMVPYLVLNGLRLRWRRQTYGRTDDPAQRIGKSLSGAHALSFGASRRGIGFDALFQTAPGDGTYAGYSDIDSAISGASRVVTLVDADGTSGSYVLLNVPELVPLSADYTAAGSWWTCRLELGKV